MSLDAPSSDRRQVSHAGAVALAILVTFLWSSSWVLIRWGLDDQALAPITFAALRYGLAALVLVGWVLGRPSLRSGLRRLSSSDWVRLTVLGVVFYAVTQGSQFVAIDHQPAASTSLVLSMTPLLVAAVANRWLAEAPTGRQFGGAVLVAVGAWLYFAGGLGATVVGMAAALVSLAANTASALLGRRVNRPADVPPVVVTAVSMAVGALVLVAVGVSAEGVPHVSAAGWGIVGWLALVNTALAFTLWNLSLRRLSALESAALNNTMLIQIAGLAWIFLGEPPGALGVVGIVAVSLGVLLTQIGGPVRRTDATVRR